MAAADSNAGDNVVELITQTEKPMINIFTVSYPRRKPRDQLTILLETESSPLNQVMLWIWSGSRYSGLLCMALSSTVYFLMEVISNTFWVQSIPLFETAFTRCTTILILSYLWLRRSGQPVFGLSHVRNLLVSRALMGYLSLSSFVHSKVTFISGYCIKSNNSNHGFNNGKNHPAREVENS
ncbi:Nodulin MtN21 /EamA-like transporter family protein [Quillaja saponaria]|uniref:Nodulin MtN21 /EamA-like transporter family protein n=1 Tax=Quillaja saponaria TaxID=32244 RepID=A0AAD7LV89_QUISA|nr:Nodulin MtN21 /EamA-like transporter family protein [Quillaja saponaria]